MARVRRLLAVWTAIGAMVAADASAQDCPEWLPLGCIEFPPCPEWVCPERALSNPPARDLKTQPGPAEQVARTTPPSGSATGSATRPARPAAADPVTNPQPKQTRASEPPRPPKAVRPTRSLAQQKEGPRPAARPDPKMSNQEKDALFQKFLEWQAQRPDAATSR
jgi:hypothetical protein